MREAEGPYIKIFDQRSKVHACNIYGRMAKSVLPYVMAIHDINRPVFLLAVDEATATDEAHMPAALQAWLKAYSRATELLILCSTQPVALNTASEVVRLSGAPPPKHRAQLAPLQRAPPNTPRLDTDAPR